MHHGEIVEGLLGSRSRVAVLRTLWRAHVPMNASQIAARTGFTRPAVASALADLSNAGVVLSSSAGRANVHQLIRGNITVERLIDPLFAAEEALPEDMERELRTTFAESAVSVVLFGSRARGDQDMDSDVDVVLVAEDQAGKAVLDERLHRYGREFRTRYGASLSAVTYDVREADALWRTSPAFFESLKREGLVLSGTSPWEWSDEGR